jgi:3-oxoacyl-[acyl-carrier protein] reductase
MIVDVSNKVVVVTGSSKGIGKELILAFSNEGSKVVINYLNSEDEAISLYNKIIKHNPNCIKVKADTTKKEDVLKLYQDTINRFGKVDILINNAGICDDNLVNLMTEEQWDNVINVNLKGAYICSQIFSKAMIHQHNGKIINIASLKGEEGCKGQVNYCASKAGLIGFTKALAKELGEYNIAVNAVCPGFISTDLNKLNKEKRKIAENRSLLSYEFSLEDLIAFILFMSSDKCLGVSGRVFNLDSRMQL